MTFDGTAWRGDWSLRSSELCNFVEAEVVAEERNSAPENLERENLGTWTRVLSFGA